VSTLAVVNLAILLSSSAVFSVLYIVSVRPAHLTVSTGRSAYRLCGRLRAIATIVEFVAVLGYVGYKLLPPLVPLPEKFQWPYWVSLFVALAVGVPSIWLMGVGLRDAGREAAVPDPSHTMYAGIYLRVRHPQAIGEAFVWFAVAFGLNSPFLVLYSVIWLPVFYAFCVVEESDLLVRFGDSYATYQREVGMIIPRRKQQSGAT
jgi:protein-S-isoprenylcysteine O-methyltransferase Ste14